MTQKKYLYTFYDEELAPNGIRAIEDERDDPWFVAEDVCKALEYDNPELAVSKYVEEWRKKHTVIPVLHSSKKILVVSSRGVQGLCFFSQSTKASKFVDWIWYHVIRPAFPEYYRKDG